MNRLAKVIFSLILATVFFVYSCTNDKNPSPYREILSEPLFAAVTDSIKADPRNAELYFRRAIMLKSDLLDKKQNTKESIATLEKAYAIAPQLLELNFNLAFKYAQDKNLKVISLCDSLIKKDSLNIHPEPYYFKGVYYYNTGNKEKAIELFDLAIVHEYNFLDAYIDKGRTLYEMKKYNEAFATLQRAASITPTFADAYYWMGKCQEAIGEKDEA